MAKGIIKQYIGGGKYTVEVVYERSRIDAELLKLAEAKTKLEEKLYTGTREQDDIILLQIASINKRIAFLNEKMPQNVTHDIYCADFTENLQVGAEVGVIEIMRRHNPFIVSDPEPLTRTLLIIQPGFTTAARYNALRDGITGTALSTSPAGTYWNLALTPGLTRWKPRYRYGLITEIDGDSCSVQLTDLTFIQESAAQIDIDQAPLFLENVPIYYMDCNGLAFEVGDEVIVEFTDNLWTSPKVIGFTGPPEECQESYYFAALFLKYASDAIPTQSSDIYEKHFFKIWANGALEWVTEAEANAQCNHDPWTITKQRPFSGLFEWSEGIGEMPPIICESEVLNVNGPAIPYDYGIFTAIYNSGNAWACPTFPANNKTIFEIDGIEFNIWQSLIAVCVESKAGATIIHKHNIRKVETETRREEYIGYYTQTYQESWWEATPQVFDLSTDDFCVKQGFISRYYNPPLANGGYIVTEIRDLAYDQYGNELPEADYAYFRFGRITPAIHSFRHTLSYEDNHRSSYSISTTPYKWDGPHPSGIGAAWLNYAIGRRDGTIASDDLEAYNAGRYHLISTTSGVRNASGAHIYSDQVEPPPYIWVYVAPCEISQGAVILPCDFIVSLTGYPPNESAWNTMDGSLPRCVMRWTEETRESGGEVYQKNIAEFPLAGEHYTEGDDIDNHVTHYFGYCGKSTESIIAIYYSFDEEHPTWIFIKINFTQTSDDGNDLDEKTLSMTVERGTGRVIDYSVANGFVTVGTYINPGSGESVFPEARDLAAYTSFLYNKKVELGKTTYLVARMMKKS